MLNRSRRREIEERLKKGTMNPGHLNSLSVNDLASLCRALGIETPHKRTDMVNALLRLNGKSVKVPSAPTYNVSRDGLNEMILECLNDPTKPLKCGKKYQRPLWSQCCMCCAVSMVLHRSVLTIF